MANVNLKTVLPNDNQITVTDKINFNFDQILTMNGGPSGDPGPSGNKGIPGQQGLQGITGDDGSPGNKWYVGFGTPPVQPTPAIYNEEDLFLSTSDNFIWEFDGTFWVKTTSELKVALGEFKADSATDTAVILQSGSKNLVISSIDYDAGALNPNSIAYDSKLKIIASPGRFIELGLDLGGTEDQADHVIVQLDGSNDLSIINNGGGIIMSGDGIFSLSSTSTMDLNSLISITQTDAQYTGTIANTTDLVNKAYVDAAELAATVDGAGVSGNAYSIVRIGASPYKAEAFDGVTINDSSVTIDTTGTDFTHKLIVNGTTKTEYFAGGAWDQVNDSNYIILGDKLEIWGSLSTFVTNTNDVDVSIPFPINFGLLNNPVINITVSDTPGSGQQSVEIQWSVKNLFTATSYTSFTLFNNLAAQTFANRLLRIQWHAIGGHQNRSSSQQASAQVGTATQSA